MGGGHRSDYEIWSGGRWGSRVCLSTGAVIRREHGDRLRLGQTREEDHCKRKETHTQLKNGFHVLTLTFDL